MDVDGIDLSEIFMSMGLGGTGGMGGNMGNRMGSSFGGMPGFSMNGMNGMGTSHSSCKSQGRGIIKAGEMVIVHSLNKAKDRHAGGG